jgi:hypothetical protein
MLTIFLEISIITSIKDLPPGGVSGWNPDREGEADGWKPPQFPTAECRLEYYRRNPIWIVDRYG